MGDGQAFTRVNGDLAASEESTLHFQMSWKCFERVLFVRLEGSGHIKWPEESATAAPSGKNGEYEDAISADVDST